MRGRGRGIGVRASEAGRGDLVVRWIGAAARRNGKRLASPPEPTRPGAEVIRLSWAATFGRTSDPAAPRDGAGIVTALPGLPGNVLHGQRRSAGTIRAV